MESANGHSHSVTITKAQIDAGGAVTLTLSGNGHTHDLNALQGSEQRGQTCPHYGVIIGKHNADIAHGSGNDATTWPPVAEGPAWNAPPSSVFSWVRA